MAGILAMKSGTDAKGLEAKANQNEESGHIQPREFFWDSIVLFVLTAILGLTAIDVITEFVRGSGVECYVPGGLSELLSSEYVNNFCSGSLPMSEYFPVFIVVSGVLISVPHYLWLNHYGGNFEFFFSLAKTLDRLRDEATGKYSSHNHQTIQQLEAAFSTYQQNTIFYIYIAKLLLQWAFSVISFIVAVALFTDFNPIFNCPRDNITMIPSWPIEEQAVCVFTSLRLIWLIRFAYLLLIVFVFIGLTWALLWCASTHAVELGSSDVAKFTFHSGIPSHYYVAKLPIPKWKCCEGLRRAVYRLVNSVPWITRRGPRIHSDLDFMVMKLFRTDSGLGHVFKEVQVERELQKLIVDDQLLLNLHYTTQNSFLAENLVDSPQGMEPRGRTFGRDLLCTCCTTSHDEGYEGRLYMKWKFVKEQEMDGVYTFEQLDVNRPLEVTNLLQGAILGFGARAPNNVSAISVSFGGTGYATALARVFGWVGSVNFNPYYHSTEHPVSVKHYYTNLVSIECNEYLLADDIGQYNEVVDNLKSLWVRPNHSSDAHETSFVVLGPIPKDKGVHITTDENMSNSQKGNNAVVLTVRPTNIRGKDVSKEFLSYRPPKRSFERLGHEVQVRKEELDWKAREVESPSLKQELHPQKHQQPSGVHEQQTSHCSSDQKPAIHLLESLGCGDCTCTVEFATYRFTNNPPTVRPVYFDVSPTSAESPSEDEESASDSEKSQKGAVQREE